MAAVATTSSSSAAARRLRARQPAVGRPVDPASSCSRPAGPTSGSSRSSTCPRRSRSRSAAASMTGATSRSRSRSWAAGASTTPGQGARRQQQHQRPIFQRGNPLDYERWAADPGMAELDFAHCLPYFRRMEDCLAAAADDPFRGHGGPARPGARAGHEPALHGVLRSVQEAGYPLTDDVNGDRQEGFAPFDRNIHRGRRCPPPVPISIPSWASGRTSRSAPRAFVTRLLFDGLAGHRRRGRPARRRDGDGSWPARSSSPAAPSIRRSSCSSRASGRLRSSRPSASRWSPTCRASGGTSRTTSRSTSSTAPPAGLDAAARRSSGAGRSSARSGCSSAAGPGATNHFEGGGFVRTNDEVAYPNLMFHFLPLAIRYDGLRPGPRLPGPRRPDVLRRAGLYHAQEHRSACASGAALQLPLDRPGPARVGRGRPRRAGHPGQPAMGALQRRRGLTRARVETDEEILDWVGATPRPRSTRRAQHGWASMRWP